MAQENEIAIISMEIDGVTYLVSTHFTEGEETLVDKITRLVQGDEKIVENHALQHCKALLYPVKCGIIGM